MNIALEFRSVKTRLYVAYIADALNGGFPQCKPGDTLSRALHHINSGNASAYRDMWDKIHKVYDSFRMYEMSESEIDEMYATFVSSGYVNGTRKITGMDIMESKRRWDNYGWKRYENKRNGRRQIARVAAVPVLACFGIVLPQ